METVTAESMAALAAPAAPKKRRRSKAEIVADEMAAAQAAAQAAIAAPKPAAEPNSKRLGCEIALRKHYDRIEQRSDGRIIARDNILLDRLVVEALSWREFLSAIVRAPRLTPKQMRRRCELLASSKGFEAREHTVTTNVLDVRRSIVVVNARTGTIVIDEPDWAHAHALVVALPSIAGREISPLTEDLVKEVAERKGYTVNLSLATARFVDARDPCRGIPADRPFAIGALAKVLTLPQIRPFRFEPRRKAGADPGSVPLIDRRPEREAAAIEERRRVNEMSDEEREQYAADHPEFRGGDAL